MKKRKKLRIIIALIVSFALGYYVGKNVSVKPASGGDKASRSIAETIKDFESGYNEGDLEKVLNCFSTQGAMIPNITLKLLNSVASKFLGADISKNVINIMWSLGAQASQWKITLNDISYIDDNNADAFVTVKYLGHKADEFYKQKGIDGTQTKITMVKENNDWKIAKLWGN